MKCVCVLVKKVKNAFLLYVFIARRKTYKTHCYCMISENIPQDCPLYSVNDVEVVEYNLLHLV